MVLERVEDLHDQIDVYQRIISLPFLPATRRWIIIYNLSGTLKTLSGRLGKDPNVPGLDACIEFQREEVQTVLAALELPNQRLFLDGTNPLHLSLRHAATNLAGSLGLRYKHSKNVADLEEAAKHLRHSISLDVEYFAFFPLANVLNEIANRTHDAATRDEAVHYYRKTLERPTDNSRRHFFLEHLAGALRSRFQETSSPDDATRALQIHLEALELLSPEQPQRYYTFYNIASLYIFPNVPFYDIPFSLQYAISLVGDIHGSPRERLRLVRMLLRDLRPLVLSMPKETSGDLHALLLEIYGKAVSLLPQVAVFDLDIKLRLSALANSETLGTEAALLAINLSQPELALELLEAGRAVFWSQARNLRTPFDSLPPKLAEEFLTLSRTLEKSSHLIAQMHRPGIEPTHRLWDEALVTRRYQSDRFVELTKEVRTFPGFKDFLANQPYSHLAKAALKGPVVVLIPSTLVSYAILIKNTGASYVRLKSPKDRLQVLGMSLRSQNLRSRQAGEDFEERHIVRHTVDHSYELLAELWVDIVEPIIKALGLEVMEGRERPRVTWLPTGPFTFLPIHAAGVYRSSVRCCSNYMVSSYAPSISTLLSTQKVPGSTILRRENAKALLVAVSDIPGMPRLPSTKKEIEAISKIIPSELILDIGDNQTTEGANVTTQTVLQRFAEASIVHLACHGQQDALNPLESGFCVEDGRLTVAQLMEQNSQNAFFAFLSACETAKGDSSQPDQSVHLAAAMLFAGFKSVVGTLWSMNDQDGPVVAEKVYSQLYKNETLDPDEIPYALDDATRDLREEGLRPSRWALFIHMGI
ncbi:CHAT domain-containing protein [Collybia nuda]|uniref:CHAT domain-containing protein n=1 Tax=Collybia nuda TaxID=64659 RepID=A0A9P6CDT4_9AGAR|nr:CHAT domain-containing protein [Collybia nuda]